MSESFDPLAMAIIVRARLSGPRGSAEAKLAVDTGATTTFINSDILSVIGSPPEAATMHVLITTALGIQQVPKVQLDRLEAIGLLKTGMLVLAGSIPKSAGIDGLLGLDFMRGRKLTVDFRKGMLSLK